ncbi:MAG: response regulator [Chloroflexi bacterium]|nr:response regulator [Chloroflexota bacterium]
MKRIIIADDSATARMFIKRCLQIIGLGDAEIVEAEHGKEALAAAKEQCPDILLTDLNMPVMDGETLLKWVKASPKLCELPVIIITSAGNPAKEAQLLKLGARQVINKPVSPPVMMNALKDFLED